MLPWPHRYNVRLFSAGGMAILRAVEQHQHTALSQRPVLSRSQKCGLALRALLPRPLGGGVVDHSLADAYAACAAHTRAEAKNFYYAFILLPPSRRRAIYALYSFCRTVDDAADLAPSVAEAESQLKQPTP